MKKILSIVSILLALVMMLSSVSALAYGAQGPNVLEKEVGKFWYYTEARKTDEAGNKYFVGPVGIMDYTGKAKNVKIPSKIDGFKIDRVDFSYLRGFEEYNKRLSVIKSLEIPTSVIYVNLTCSKKIEKITLKHKKKAPKLMFYNGEYKNTKKGIKFYVKNKKVAKSLKKQLKNSGAKKPKIYIGKKLYK